MIVFLVFLCFFMLGYAYFGYPLLLLLFASWRPIELKIREKPTDNTPLLSIIITVRNEERVIRQKLEQTLPLSYAGESIASGLLSGQKKVQLIVASDASSDATDSIVSEFFPAGVELVRLEERGGKEKAQKAAIQKARGVIIVFTDAKIRLNQDALDCFRRYFTNPEVGAVSSIDRVESDEKQSSGEGFYVSYEMWLRSLESRFSSLVGLSGSCFAVRKAVCTNLSTNIPSDFALLLDARKMGLRGIHAPDIVGTYSAVKTEEEEFYRKVRTVLRGMTTLVSCKEVMCPVFFGSFSWQIISHKLCRWLVPWFFIGGCLGAFYLAFSSFFFACLSALLLIFWALAATAYCFPAMRNNLFLKVPLFFVISNAAVAVAWIKYLSGQRSVAWNPSAKPS